MRGKDRAYLKSLAQKTEVSLIIGKNGCTDSVIRQIDQILNKRELVKIKLLDNVTENRDEIVEKILEGLDAEFVQLLGSKFTIYRPSEEGKIVFPR